MATFNYQEAPSQQSTGQPLPDGFWRFRCEPVGENGGMDRRITQTKRVMFVGSFIATEDNPEEGVGRIIFENFVVGPPNDEDPKTYEWSYEVPDGNGGTKVVNNFGLSRLVNISKAMQIPPTDNLEALAAEMVDKTFIAETKLEFDDYSGRERPKIMNVFPDGTKKLGPKRKSNTPTFAQMSQENANRPKYTPPEHTDL